MFFSRIGKVQGMTVLKTDLDDDTIVYGLEQDDTSVTATGDSSGDMNNISFVAARLYSSVSGRRTTQGAIKIYSVGDSSSA